MIALYVCSMVLASAVSAAAYSAGRGDLYLFTAVLCGLCAVIGAIAAVTE